MLWQREQIDTIEAAITSARAGRPTVLTITGRAGRGKSAMLREVARRARGFRVLEGFGEDAHHQEPLDLLRRFASDTGPGFPEDSLRADQDPLGRLDALVSDGGPLLITVDDLHHADRASVRALTRLVRRAVGERLLVAVSLCPAHPSDPDVRPRPTGWGGDVFAVTVEGVTLAQASALVRRVRPDAGPALVRRLWEHTDRSPLSLSSLVAQYTAAELESARDFPAPRELVEDVRRTVHDASPEASALLNAVAVLGHTWSDLPTVGAIARVTDPSAAAQVLLDAGLLVSGVPDPSVTLRTAHVLVARAVYQSIPLPERRELHRRAAAELRTPMAVLEHRVAATDDHDDALADALARAAESAHAKGAYRRSGRLLRWSSRITSAPGPRVSRWLDALYVGIRSRDLGAVRAEMPLVDEAADRARRALVQGSLLVVEGHWREAVTVFAAVPESTLAAADAPTRHRVLLQWAWAALATGRGTEEAGRLLDRALAVPHRDPALDDVHTFTVGWLGRSRPGERTSARPLLGPARDPARTPLRATHMLAWRGTVHAWAGLPRSAEADLCEVAARVRGGLVDSGADVHHATLAYAYWQSCAWTLARDAMAAAHDATVAEAHPLVRAVEPLLAAVQGDAVAADLVLGELEERLATTPWREAVRLFGVAATVRHHAVGHAEERSGHLARLRARFGDRAVRAGGDTGGLWALHMAQAALWAGEDDLAEEHVRAVEGGVPRPDWLDWVPDWLRGLVAWSEGRPDTAHRLMTRAAAVDSFDLPLYRAHLLADLARLTATEAGPGAAEAIRGRALRAYRRIGATPYVERLEAPASGSVRPPVPDVFAPLSDRERAVAALVVRGMSYAQIARDLCVTRSTVGFHLSNIYAKTGVASRHELIDLVHSWSP
ncbi:LuxR family transcriptional regulator [Nocardiopsis sp. MG754419]|uniref:helix-turn-helix transcriptional regulator n=1 Tax=Nocardiopsis sp. MG754419 TaxID=2259865 RepID=UPI001BAD3095|nr:LuxR family transcriptional regulator [Nocardiopsis sp. MG754419]